MREIEAKTSKAVSPTLPSWSIASKLSRPANQARATLHSELDAERAQAGDSQLRAAEWQTEVRAYTEASVAQWKAKYSAATLKKQRLRDTNHKTSSSANS